MPAKQKKAHVSFEWTNGRTTAHCLLPPKPVNITCGFLSAAKSAASFKNPPQALKINSKARVEFVSSSRTRRYPSSRLIFPVIKNPKTNSKNLTMVNFSIGHINEIK